MVSVKHNFQSQKADSNDASIIRPSNWNEDHVIKQSGQRLLGRAVASEGDTSEVGLGRGLEFSSGALAVKSEILNKEETTTHIGETAVRYDVAQELTKEQQKQARDNMGATDTMPVGAVIMMASNATIVPPGYLLMNGSSVSATYPELRAYGITAGWATDAGGNPIIPDMGGYFPRGWRPGQTVDSGRVFGSVQQDALQNITGSVKTSAGKFDSHLVNGAFAIGSQNLAGSGSAGFAEHAQATFDASRVVRTAIETRPINRTFTYWVKAYTADVDTSNINLANLTNDIQNRLLKTETAVNSDKLNGKTEAQLMFGGGQIWQGVSRTANTVYQNTTGKTIFLTVNISNGYGTIQMSPVAAPYEWGTATEVGGGQMWVMGVPVPNGYYYKTTTGGTYRELR